MIHLPSTCISGISDATLSYWVDDQTILSPPNKSSTDNSIFRSYAKIFPRSAVWSVSSCVQRLILPRSLNWFCHVSKSPIVLSNSARSSAIVFTLTLNCTDLVSVLTCASDAELVRNWSSVNEFSTIRFLVLISPIPFRICCSSQLATRNSQTALYSQFLNPIVSIPDEHQKFVRYFYQDAIIKYDGSSTHQIEGTISKETLYFPSQRYNVFR
jgi:hypothetical protein